MEAIARFFYILLVSALFVQCSPSSPSQAASSLPDLSIIPLPDSISVFGKFSNVKELVLADEEFWKKHQTWLSTFPVKVRFDKNQENTKLKVDEQLSQLTYTLKVSNDSIVIGASSEKDLRNAFVTLLQLFDQYDGKLPIVVIQDKAEFDYRGMHLDVGRHLFEVEDIKQYIDYLTYYKYNRFHWHLTEDQGWRIEIPAYPKLQEVAAYRPETLIGHYNDQPHQFDQTRYGGFYTQSEIKEVVAYAAARGVEIIPEIEMPGHAQAAIAAYPELGCTGEQIEVATKWGVFKDVFCPSPETFNFLKTVIDDVVELFPSSYIHIGGDECPKDQWKASPFCQNLMKKEGLKDEYELQAYFIGVMADYIQSKGRSIIGWDEILEGGLHPSAIVMSWRGTDGAVAAAKAGNRAIMTPGSHCYFDHYQSSHPDEPLAIGGLTRLEDVYHFNPMPDELNAEERSKIWGVQGNVWTEYMEDFEQVSYMALARMIALSEVQWNQEDQRNYKNFTDRFANHVTYWKENDVDVADHLLDLGVVVHTSPTGSYAVTKKPKEEARVSVIHLDEKSELNTDTFYLKESGIYSLYSESEGEIGRYTSIEYRPHLANNANLILENQPSDSYSGSGSDALINGVFGSEKKYGGDEWLGFSGTDLTAFLTFPEAIDTELITIQFYKGEGQWIYLPSSIDVFTSDDGLEYTKLNSTDDIASTDKVISIEIPLKTRTQFIKIHAINHGVIATGKQGAGHEAWLFVGEIVID